MKLFTNFCGFLVLSISSMMGLVYLFGGIDSISNYLKCDDSITKSAYLKLCGSYFTYAFAFLMVGFALVAIIYLLRHIAYKDEK